MGERQILHLQAASSWHPANSTTTNWQGHAQLSFVLVSTLTIRCRPSLSTTWQPLEPIAFMGRKLTDAALKWYTYKKECYSENASINARHVSTTITRIFYWLPPQKYTSSCAWDSTCKVMCSLESTWKVLTIGPLTSSQRCTSHTKPTWSTQRCLDLELYSLHLFLYIKINMIHLNNLLLNNLHFTDYLPSTFTQIQTIFPGLRRLVHYTWFSIKDSTIYVLQYQYGAWHSNNHSSTDSSHQRWSCATKPSSPNTLSSWETN